MWFARASYGDMFCITKARYSPGNDVRFAVGDLEIITYYVWFRTETRIISQTEKNISGYYCYQVPNHQF